MKTVYFFSISVALLSASRCTSAIQAPITTDISDMDMLMMTQTNSEQLPSVPGMQNPIAQAKESMKELTQMVDQADAKKMGYGEYEVFKKLRKTLKKRGPKSDQVAKKIHNLMKNGHGDTSSHHKPSGNSQNSSGNNDQSQQKSK